MQKILARNMKFVEFELDSLRESTSSILGQFSENNWLTEKLLELFSDRRATKNQKWLRRELKQVTTVFQDELLSNLAKVQKAFMELHLGLEKDMKQLVDTQTYDQRIHGKQAEKRLHDLSDDFKDGTLAAARANSLAQDVLSDAVYSESEMKKMLQLFFQHAHSGEWNNLNEIGLRVDGFAEINPKKLKELKSIHKKFASGVLSAEEVQRLLTPMMHKNEIPPPNNPDLDLLTYLVNIIQGQQKNDESVPRYEPHLVILFEHEKAWMSGQLSTESLFQLVQHQIKSRNLPANWFLRENVPETKKIKLKTKKYLAKSYEKVKSGKMSKGQFFAELMDLYQEGKISFDIMNRVTKSLEQFNDYVTNNKGNIYHKTTAGKKKKKKKKKKKAGRKNNKKKKKLIEEEIAKKVKKGRKESVREKVDKKPKEKKMDKKPKEKKMDKKPKEEKIDMKIEEEKIDMKIEEEKIDMKLEEKIDMKLEEKDEIKSEAVKDETLMDERRKELNKKRAIHQEQKRRMEQEKAALENAK